ncbi:hypothetical protein [Curtobacterium caseinilyticum]|uniref:Secreted protein n=1 Tax=Curtobacterium caseinilyticum TaxID=3055137 RepID=A0ABT7TTK7_9MICO|nr:hypothetical protein [Curtobacterium caseinilyticum]MDM7892923.1 hypothetical protein [Curtobacterium caseinilyticum]
MTRHPKRPFAVRSAAVLAIAAVVTGVLALPAHADPADASAVAPVAQGDDWTVTPTAGGYDVTLDLDAPLPIRAAAPVLVVDGQDVGVARTSLDQRQVTVTTADPAVARASDVSLGWTSDVDQSAPAAAPQVVAPQAAPADAPAPIDADPAATGTYAVARADYDLGTQSETIRGFGGRKGEMRAAVFLPKGAPGKRPVVVFLHGRHEACAGGTPTDAGWPCGRGQTDIPSYRGYAAAGTALASNGYVVVSISANAINALDGTYADDGGAVARGQLVLDHLDLLRKADAGQEQRLSPLLVGKLDLSDVGLMGHSRGGDGVVRAAVLNQQRSKPFGIKAVLPLAPTDFGRMTLPDTNTAVVLPYCDGDVSDLQGQHFFDDSRTAYGDDVLRSSILVMGANHNFFNTTWTPGKYPLASSDDWWDDTDAVCGPKAKTSTRLSAAKQYAVGTSLVSGFFRLTLGGEQQFLPYFDGSGRKPASLGTADVRVTASLPGAGRRDLALFTAADRAVTTTGQVTATTCASVSDVQAEPALPACVSSASNAPDFTPAWLAPAVPATPSLHVAPTRALTGGQVHVAVPAARGDLSRFASLSLRLAPDDTSRTNADVTLSLRDAAGHVAKQRLADVSRAGQRLPGSRNAPRKTLLQQAQVPLSAFAGVDLTAVREVVLDVPAGNGGVLLSDLSVLPTSSLGTPHVVDRPTVRIADRVVDEGSGRATVRAAVVLSRPAQQTATAYFDLAEVYDDHVTPTMQPVVFRPGEVCKAVSVPVLGDRRASTSQTTGYPMTVSNTQGGAVLGDATGTLTVREDDGVRDDRGRVVASAQPVGVAGDPCTEALAKPTTVTPSAATVQRGKRVTFSASGFRAGEGVRFRVEQTTVAWVKADAKGRVSLAFDGTASLSVAKHTVSVLGAGSRRTGSGTFSVRK